MGIKKGGLASAQESSNAGEGNAFSRTTTYGISLLNDPEKAALADFNLVFASLPWQIVQAHPHMHELPDDNFSPLIPAAERLQQLLEARQ